MSKCIYPDGEEPGAAWGLGEDASYVKTTTLADGGVMYEKAPKPAHPFVLQRLDLGEWRRFMSFPEAAHLVTVCLALIEHFPREHWRVMKNDGETTVAILEYHPPVVEKRETRQ